jgi:hypothetical protein
MRALRGLFFGLAGHFGKSPKMAIAEIQEKINYRIRNVGLDATQLA